MVYILLAGGIFNAVLVPQLVRRIKERPRRRRRLRQPGDHARRRSSSASSRRCSWSPAPLLLRLYLDGRYLDPDRVTQLESIVALTRWCLPQVFFYGMYVLVGQVLNARGRFGPMMWAPIANNLSSVGDARHLPRRLRTDRRRRRPGPRRSAPSQEVLLGLGSTLGIVAQFLVLVPYLRALGLHLPTRASTSATPSCERRCRSACGPCCSWSPPRRRTSSWSSSPRAARPTAATAPATPSTPTAC